MLNGYRLYGPPRMRAKYGRWIGRHTAVEYVGGDGTLTGIILIPKPVVNIFDYQDLTVGVYVYEGYGMEVHGWSSYAQTKFIQNRPFPSVASTNKKRRR